MLKLIIKYLLKIQHVEKPYCIRNIKGILQSTTTKSITHNCPYNTIGNHCSLGL